MKGLSIAIAVSLSVTAASASVEPVIIQPYTPYTVPSGKTLLIDNVSGTGAIVLNKDAVSLTLNANFFNQRSRTDNHNISTVSYPLMIPTGWRISCATEYACLFGRLVDGTDLYAAVPHGIKSGSVKGGMLAMGMQLPSAAPVRVAVETADDPRGEWTPASNIVVSAGADTRTRMLAIPVDEKQKFARTKVRHVR
jgi:hypothetical protein